MRNPTSIIKYQTLEGKIEFAQILEKESKVDAGCYFIRTPQGQQTFIPKAAKLSRQMIDRDLWEIVCKYQKSNNHGQKERN